MKSPRMDMRSSLAHLPARKQRELERILTILHQEFGEAVKASSSSSPTSSPTASCCMS